MAEKKLKYTAAEIDLAIDKVKSMPAEGVVGPQGPAGTDGKEVELQKTSTHIQWRYVGGDWNNLVALADLKGDKGEGANVDLSDYALKSWVDEQIERVQTGGSVDLSSYYTKTEVDTKLSSKADKIDLHSHSNKSVLDGITSTKVTEWNNKSTFDGNYNNLINKPTIPEAYDDSSIKSIINLKANISDVPTRVSQLINDSGFLITHQDISHKLDKIHNTSTTAHSDIRALIDGLTERLNALANSDDTTLDQMAEVVAYIKNNKTLIDSITTSKINVSDIVDDLITSVNNKPLSANQGVELKTLIDYLTIVVNSKADTTTLTSHTSNTTYHITSAERTSWNAKSNLALGTSSTTAYRGDFGNTAYTHSQSVHAPSNAQKNSDITKEEIEAKLTGAITSHTHNYASTSIATATSDGLLSATDKTKLDSMPTIYKSTDEPSDLTGNEGDIWIVYQ